MRMRMLMSCNVQLHVMIHGTKKAKSPKGIVYHHIGEMLHTCYVNGDLFLISCEYPYPYTSLSQRGNAFRHTVLQTEQHINRSVCEVRCVM